MKEYLKYYGSIYIIFIIAVIVAGAMYITDLPNVMREKIGGFQVAPVKDSTKDSATGDLPMVKGVLSPPVNVAAYLNPTQQMIDKGKQTFSVSCASCHGADGKGDGVAGAMLNPKPRNFHDPANWKNGTTLTMMYQTIEKGIPNTGMASFSNIPPEDRLDIIVYIRTLAPFYPPVTQQQVDSLDLVYSLTKGVKQPNQIPIKLAMEKILQQAHPVDSMVKKMVSSVKENKTDTGAIVLKGITNNMTKALTVLALDSAWNSSPAGLVKIFDSNPVQNGFKARASYMLTQNQLSALHAYLRNLFAANRI